MWSVVNKQYSKRLHKNKKMNIEAMVNGNISERLFSNPAKLYLLWK